MEETITLPRQLDSRLENSGQYETRLVSTIKDNAWDAFLTQTEGGDLLQSSWWAELKSVAGWQVRRLIVKENNHIVAGAQMLLRPLPFPLGAVGYVPRGPVLAVDKPELAQLVLKKLKAAARSHRVQLLFVQPPRPYTALDHTFQPEGFYPTRAKMAPLSTLRIDLTPDPEEILAQMRTSTRANVRRSSRKEIIIRQGTEADLDIFVELHAASSQRQGFSTASEEYFAHMWRIFAPANKGVLLISEYKGQAVSAMLAVGFGKTIWAKRFGWSGEQPKRSPNEGLLWAAMQWAKAQGYHWFDQDGIKWDAAQALLNDQPMPESVKRSPSNFKLGFGGQPLIFPKGHVYIYNPVLRFGYTSLFPKLARWPLTKRIINRLRLS